MAASRILRSEPANNDLEEIWIHLARTASAEIADFVLARLYEAIRRAADAPRLYPPRTEYAGHPRRINVFDYAIFLRFSRKATAYWCGACCTDDVIWRGSFKSRLRSEKIVLIAAAT